MQSTVYKVKIPAKINLRLAVTGKRGLLHTLDMIICPYDKLYDEVEFIPTDSCKYKRNGKCAEQDGCKNCITAVDIKGAYTGFKPSRFKEFYLPKVQLIAQKLKVCGRLVVRKGVPLGAGLGGSTASIVGALKAMLLYLESTGQSAELDDGFLLSLGSDVPCMFKGGLCRVRGVGERLDAIPFDLGCNFAVRIAKGGADSGECYALFDKLEIAEKTVRAVEFKEEEREYGELSRQEFLKILSECRNDLTLPALTLNPRIGKLIDKMKKQFDFVIMSGSGSAVVGFDLPKEE